MKPETARRLKQRLSAVFDWAKAAGYLQGENPVAGVSKGLPKQPDRKAHYRAMAPDDVPGFVQRLCADGHDRSTAMAFEFLILTAARTSEVLEAEWLEIDIENAVWTIPGTRMKAGKEHRVPLSKRCVELLSEAKERLPLCEFIFPGVKEGKPLSNMAFLMTLRRMGYIEWAQHNGIPVPGALLDAGKKQGLSLVSCRDECEKLHQENNKLRVESEKASPGKNSTTSGLKKEIGALHKILLAIGERQTFGFKKSRLSFKINLSRSSSATIFFRRELSPWS